MNRVGILARASTSNEIFQTKYWHEFRHCSRRHSTKINQNKVIERKK